VKTGILGDIHANLSALQAVLRQFEAEGVERIVSVGDIVGYGSRPAECIRLVRSVGATVVKGNHDAACVGELDMRYFNSHAREALRWTQGVLGEKDLRWLASLPMTHDFDDCCVGHGTYARPELFNYIQGPSDADPSLEAMSVPVCFVGHTHVPVTLLRLEDDPEHTAYTLDAEVDLTDVRRALINVGSVGQPRDEDPRAAYGIYDPGERRAWIRRVPYDIEDEAERIRAAGLPTVLAQRLFLGV
jgi:diadenosine tetraphosphatase ApaH/serine/threonine PP2A family protein phosphatase